MTHRTDPRPMEDRWRSMGWIVEWNDTLRAYRIRDGEEDSTGMMLMDHRRTVDEVEAFVVAHAVQP